MAVEQVWSLENAVNRAFTEVVAKFRFETTESELSDVVILTISCDFYELVMNNVSANTGTWPLKFLRLLSQRCFVVRLDLRDSGAST